jgi:proline dehydrogenase
MRFVAGETFEQAVEAVRQLGSQGARVSLDYLGESVRSFDEAVSASRIYLTTIRQVATLNVPISLSLKPSQFGLDLNRERCLTVLAEVVSAAAAVPLGIRLDMEDSSHTDGTLWLGRELGKQGLPVGVVLQACLYRTPRDLETVLEAGGSVRLCKGAYLEPPSIAYPRKADVDDAYARLLDRLLRGAAGQPPPAPGRLPPAAIATHDPRLIERAIQIIHEIELSPRLYEFQMLYGVRRDLQERLLAQGYPLRIYTPWGPAWYPYFSRRLAERPANVAFILSALLHEATNKKQPSAPSAASEPSLKR